MSPPPSPASSAPTSGLAPSAPTQPRPVTLTPAPQCLYPSAPTYPRPVTLTPSLPVAPTPPTSVSFGPGILEALSYVDLPQAPYPPPVISEVDDLASTARTVAEEIRQKASLQALIASKQRSTLGALPATVTHPSATLLQSYVEEGIPAYTDLPWSRTALDEAIHYGPHASACAPDMVIIIR